MLAQNKGVYLTTFGCQMNEFDSEMMAGVLEGIGYEQVSTPEEADLILINTCCVRETAENKVWGLLGNLKTLKSKRPGLVIGICGCMPQQPGKAEEIARRAPHVDLVFGTLNRHELPALLERVKDKGEPVYDIWDKVDVIPEGLPVRRESGLKAWVPVMFGCNNYCTYCIVPYVRGRELSREPRGVLDEVRELVRQGYREVTLLGQNVNSYGKGLNQPVDFADLLKMIDGVEGLWRIRFTSSHPRDFSDKLIATIAGAKTVCEHIHLPAQAGSNRVLAKMNRGYDRGYYFGLVERIRERIPGVALSTDLMVGFPGETREDFEDTLDLVTRVRYDQAFTFVYNPRSGTPAARMADQVPQAEKSRRIQELIAVQKAIALELNQAEEGRVHEVLVEGPSESRSELLTGRTRTNKTVVFKGSMDMVGSLVNVRVETGTLTYLTGRPV